MLRVTELVYDRARIGIQAVWHHRTDFYSNFIYPSKALGFD